MGTSKKVELGGQQFLAGQGLDDDVQTGQNGVSLGQEVAVGQQLGLRNTGELGELLLVFGVGLDETGNHPDNLFDLKSPEILIGKWFLPEENLRSDVTISLGLVPGFADNTTVERVEQALAIIISRDGGSGGSDSRHGSAKLYKI
jgi:hypothetical protein